MTVLVVHANSVKLKGIFGIKTLWPWQYQQLMIILSFMENDRHVPEESVEEPWTAISSSEIVPALPDDAVGTRARLWALVLHARAIPCRLENDGAGLQLLVPAEHLLSAQHELRLFEEENRNWPPPQPQPHIMAENTLASISILLLLALFHNFIQLELWSPFGVSPDWIDLGNAQAGKILDGQWWRLLTALTLHADALHLLSNLLIGGSFVIMLCHEVGSGLGWSLLLGAGALGNQVNAYVQPATHSSVGASTAVFGAVGILAAITLVRYKNSSQRRWTLPVVAALALLALLGTEGKNSDLGAHLFGFVYGFFLGLITEYLLDRHGLPGRVLNALLTFCSVAAVVTAWYLALLK